MGNLLSDKAYEKGWVVLAYTHNGFRNTTNSKRPITKWEDYDGLKLRVIQNAMYVDMFKQLGANPTPMAVTEVFTALEMKAVDGQENPLPQIVTMRMHEVQKYLSLTRHSINSEALLIGRKTWERLSKEEQSAVLAAADEAKRWKRESLKDLEAQMLDTVKKGGMQVNDVSLAERQRMAERLKPVIERQNERVGDEFAGQFYAETVRCAPPPPRSSDQRVSRGSLSCPATETSMSKSYGFGAATAALAIAAGLGEAVAPSRAEAQVVIGAAAPLTGPRANLGRYFKQGVELAVAEINASRRRARQAAAGRLRGRPGRQPERSR